MGDTAANAQQVQEQDATQEQEARKIPNDQLDALVSPIALYPDPLLSQVLVASTYPLEIIHLQQWLAQNQDLEEDALVAAVEKENWDPSIQGMAALLRALKDMKKVSSGYCFWSGSGKIESCSKHWQARLLQMFRTTKIVGGHGHRFRDTYAVELLLAGVATEQVSTLLGHQSIRITEKHYSPWVESRQMQLEKSLRSAWKKDAFASKST